VSASPTVSTISSNFGVECNRFVTYRAIYDRMHYEGFIGGTGTRAIARTCASAIKRIRNKFRALDPTLGEIENYNGFGYCWKQADASLKALSLLTTISGSIDDESAEDGHRCDLTISVKSAYGPANPSKDRCVRSSL